MIHVQPPEGWTPPQTESASESLSSFDDIDSVLQQPQNDGEPASHPAGRKSSPASRSKSQKQPASAKQTQASKPKLATPQVAPEATPSESAPVLPNAAWSSDATRKRQKLTLMIAGALGVVAIVGCIIAAIVINSGTPQVADSGTHSAQKDPEEDSPQTQADDVANDASASDSQGTLDEAPIIQQPITQEGAIGEAPQVPGVTQGGGFSAPGQSERPEKTTQGGPQKASSGDTENRLVPDLTPKPEEGMDPTPRNPEEIDGLVESPDNFGSLQALLDAQSTSFQDLEDVVFRGTPNALSKYFVQPSRQKSFSLERRFEYPIHQLSYNKPVALSQGVRTLADLGGFPVTIDARTIALYNKTVDPIQPIDVKDQSLLEALETLGKTHGLDVMTTETGVIFTIQSPGELVESSIEFPTLPDLDIEAKEKFILAIKGLIQPGIWGTDDLSPNLEMANDTISARCSPQTEQLIRSFIEKLNASYQLTQKADNADAKAKVVSRWASTEKLRTLDAMIQPGIARTIHASLTRLKQKSGLSVLVDWQAVVQKGWWPNTMIPGEVSEPTPEDWIREVAAAMKLVPVAVDSSTIVLTTREQAASWVDIEVYPISQKLDQQVKQGQLPKLVFDLIGNQVNDLFVRVVYEPKCRCLIVVAPQNVQKQIESVVNELDRK